MSALPLTAKQERVWRYIKQCDRAPSYRQICRDLDIPLGAGIHRVILSLKQRGYVTYTPGLARSVVAIEPNSDLAQFSTADLAAEIARRLGA